VTSCSGGNSGDPSDSGKSSEFKALTREMRGVGMRSIRGLIRVKWHRKWHRKPFSLGWVDSIRDSG